MMAVGGTTEKYQVDIETLSLQRDRYAPSPYQRDENVWSTLDERFFIDYMLRNLPISSIVVYRQNDKQLIDDGLQKFTTILKFFDGHLRTFTENEFRYMEPDVNIPLLPPNAYFEDLPVEYQRLFRDYLVPFERQPEMSEALRSYSFRARNAGVPLKVAEKFASYHSKANTVGGKLADHAFFNELYGTKAYRKQKLHMAFFALSLEIHQGLYQPLRKGNIAKIAAGVNDDLITDEVFRRIDETLEGGRNVFRGINLPSTTNFIPVYQACVKLRQEGYDLLGSQAGCLKSWYETMKNRCLRGGIVWNNLEQLNSQRNFWDIAESSLFRQRGLSKLNLFSYQLEQR